MDLMTGWIFRVIVQSIVKFRKINETMKNSNDHLTELSSDGSFITENFSNVNDGRNFSQQATPTGKSGQK